jgi:hypothetical protein
MDEKERNESVRKVLTVLVYLCNEVHKLKEIAESKVFSGLLMFGRSPIEINQTGLPLIRFF